MKTVSFVYRSKLEKGSILAWICRDMYIYLTRVGLLTLCYLHFPIFSQPNPWTFALLSVQDTENFKRYVLKFQ